MLENLQEPPPPFADVIRTHFRLKAKEISAQLDRWVSLDDGISINRSNHGGPAGADATPAASARGAQLRKGVDEVKAILARLTANGEAAAS